MESIIVDIDGICFDRLERCKDADGNINWERAFNNLEVAQDSPIKGAVEATQKIAAEGYAVFYLTGRSEICWTATHDALLFNDFGINRNYQCGHALSMRKRNDNRPDFVMKQERIEQRKAWNFIAAVDDDWSGNLRDMYLGLGIPHYYTFDELFKAIRGGV